MDMTIKKMRALVQHGGVMGGVAPDGISHFRINTKYQFLECEQTLIEGAFESLVNKLALAKSGLHAMTDDERLMFLLFGAYVGAED